MLLSELPYLHLIPCMFATIFVGFGVLAFTNRKVALSFFELSYPDQDKHEDSKIFSDIRKIVDLLMIFYGIRDIFTGATFFAVAFAGTRSALGWITVLAGFVAVVDGLACKLIAKNGHMNHWGYAPYLFMIGFALLGALDTLPLGKIAQLWT